MTSPEWGVGSYVFNIDRWNSFSSDDQEFLLTQFGELTDEWWDFAIGDSQMGVDCLAGKANCDTSKYIRASADDAMTIVQPSAEDIREIRRVLEEVVLPGWV